MVEPLFEQNAGVATASNQGPAIREPDTNKLGLEREHGHAQGGCSCHLEVAVVLLDDVPTHHG
jgi:hypothetical protein